jgi:hypothetical protein
MKYYHRFLIVIAVVFMAIISASAQQKIVLVKNGQPQFNIVLSSSPTAIEKAAADALQKNIQQISGASLNIVVNKSGGPAGHILIGQAGVSQTISSLDPDGVSIKFPNANTIIITGGSGRGIINAAYVFLEEYLQMKFYALNCIKIPSSKTVVFNSNTKYANFNPYFSFREVFYKDAFDLDYCHWRAVDHTRGNVEQQWGNWAHTTFQFLPPAQYFKAHPEYYSLINGKRSPQQLCLSNPEVQQKVSDILGWNINNNKQFQSWSVGTEDNNNFCQCPQCQKLYQQYGSISGAVVNFVNPMAQKYSDKTIGILAYAKSSAPPKNITIQKNILVIYCVWNNNKLLPIMADPNAKQVINEMKDWQKLTSNMGIWDYVMNFQHLYSPFPNLYTFKSNFQFFKQNRVNFIYLQGNFFDGGEFAEARTYLMSKLAWNNNLDDKAVLNDFANQYYGKASTYIMQYINLLTKNAISSKAYLAISDNPIKHVGDFLNYGDLLTYGSILEKAENAVSEDTLYLNRVRRERLVIDYTIMRIAEKDNNLSSAVKGNPGLKDQVAASTQRFLDYTTKYLHISRLVSHPNAAYIYQEYSNAKSAILKKVQ